MSTYTDSQLSHGEQQTTLNSKYICNQCDIKPFKRKQTLQRHVASVHGKRILCPTCGKKYKAQYYKTRHKHECGNVKFKITRTKTKPNHTYTIQQKKHKVFQIRLWVTNQETTHNLDDYTSQRLLVRKYVATHYSKYSKKEKKNCVERYIRWIKQDDLFQQCKNVRKFNLVGQGRLLTYIRQKLFQKVWQFYIEDYEELGADANIYTIKHLLIKAALIFNLPEYTPNKLHKDANYLIKKTQLKQYTSYGQTKSRKEYEALQIHEFQQILKRCRQHSHIKLKNIHSADETALQSLFVHEKSKVLRRKGMNKEQIYTISQEKHMYSIWINYNYNRCIYIYIYISSIFYYLFYQYIYIEQ